MSELGNRVRAARAYAAMSQEELAGRLSFSLSTLKRVELGARALSELEERAFVDAVARATGLPSWFMTADYGDECAATARHATPEPTPH